MKSLKLLNWNDLMDAYKRACEFNLSEEFIEMLRNEIEKRNRTD